ncbi:unnamed protein product [Medioppia subpectinata]|uniref:dynamin GTPase n=1 Tax=Medioppia subpectinata TaxID=1979941 RepID=A0A7R9L6M1_9ACAR|nr:unnamed protein product [Medioppia subpectinata]CAG2115399.1 unnamed protein product [Medioppia subpectinata]
MGWWTLIAVIPIMLYIIHPLWTLYDMDAKSLILLAIAVILVTKWIVRKLEPRTRPTRAQGRVANNDTNSGNGCRSLRAMFSGDPKTTLFDPNLVKMLNELQDTLNDSLALDLPQIVVVGGQSSGKSSVLESIVGRDFLPRGSGIVTRRPLVLQIKSDKTNTRDFGVFLHLPEKKFYNFNEIRDEIIAETDRVVPESRGISPKPINLRIHSSEMLDLTLVDLPGMTRVAVGNQPKDIEFQIERMILDYISGENCLILAVTAANQDLATSDALKLANKVDPEGNRTIGVLTKLDLMDKGTDARNILLGKHDIRLKRGFHGVVNRSQKDIEGNKKMRKAMEDEHKFFVDHPSYGPSMAKRMGIEYLKQFLQKELFEHIANRMTPMMTKTEEKLRQITEDLEGIEFPEDPMEKQRILVQTIEKFCKHFKSSMGGNGWEVDVNDLSCGAIINVLMNDTFPKQIDLLFYDEKRLGRRIATAIQNSSGTRLDVFIPNTAFTTCFGPQIELFKKPSIACVDWVTDEIRKTINKCLDDINCFPNLKKSFADLTLDFVRESNKECKKIVDHLIKVEKCYPNTRHEDFIEMIGDIKTTPIAPVQVNGTALAVQQNAQNLKCDWISYQKNDLWFVLRDNTLYWFRDEKQNGKKGSLDLNGCQMVFNGWKLAIILPKSYRIISDFILAFNSGEAMAKWYQWLVEAGVTRSTRIAQTIDWDSKCDEFFESGSQLSANGLPQDMSFPDVMKPQVDEVKRYLHTYFVILKKTFKDRLPKLCQLELINATSEFIEKELRKRIMDQFSTIDEIIGEDPDKELRIELLNKKKDYIEAIAIMDKYSKMRL